MAQKGRRIIVIYYLSQGRESNFTFGSLVNIFDDDDSFEVHKFNFAQDDLDSLDGIFANSDVIFLHYSLLYQRVRPRILDFFRPLESLRNSKAFKIAMPQDEGAFPGLLDDLLVYWDIDLLVSVHFSEQEKLYPNARHTLDTVSVLPAFVKREWLRSVPPIKKLSDRSLGLAYRGRASMWRHGRANFIKSEFSLKLASIFEDAGWETDVSIAGVDRIYGDAWRKFIESARLVYGSPGGYTAIDYYGELNRQVTQVLANNQPSNFEEFNQLMPQGWDSANLLTITSRHFEAAYYGTPQILYESDYKGVIKPNLHYVPVSTNIETLDDLMPLLNDDDYLISTVEAFRKDAFKEQFTFEELKSQFKHIIDSSIGGAKSQPLVNQHVLSLKEHADARLQVISDARVESTQSSKSLPDFLIGRAKVRRGGQLVRNKSSVYARYLLIRLFVFFRRLFFHTRRVFRRIGMLMKKIIRKSRLLMLKVIRRSYYISRRVAIDSVKFVLSFIRK